MPRKPAAGRMYRARESFIIEYEGAPTQITGGVTIVREGHPLLAGHEHLFELVTPHYEIEQATAAPGEKRGAPE